MLKFKIDSLDGLDEALKPLYAKGQDGKYTLQVDGDPAASALAKMKADLETANAALKAAADEKDKKDREAEESRARATGDFEKLKEALGSENKGLKDQLEALTNRIKNGARDRAAMEAIQAAGGIPKALLPHVQGALEVVQDGEDYKVIVKGDPGKKLDAFIAGLKTEMPWGFNGSGASGGGAPQSGGAAPAKTMPRSQFQTLAPAAQMDHIKAGGTVTD